MKHYVLRNNHANVVKKEPTMSKRVRNIDVVLRDSAAKASAEIVVEFYQALNNLVEDQVYIVNFRVPLEEPVGGPSHWAGRTAIFWGDLENKWSLLGSEKSWASQVLNLSSRTILVGGSVLLLAQIGRVDQPVAAIHSNFKTAALEIGLTNTGTGTHFAPDGRTHSASTRLGALSLLSEFVSLDHGTHLADILRGYIGLTEPQRNYESKLAIQLIHRSGGDHLVTLAVDTMLDHIEDPLRIPDLSNLLNTSTRQLQRRFQSKTGVKLLTTYRELRMERAYSLLRYTDMPQTEISAATGFSSNTALTRAFLDHYKAKPKDVRNQRFLGEFSNQ
ncbi:helix-turn-helix domain-containing protein [Rhodobacteraceae bacterium B1Z28]|uniref:Helix-turn-helix domain-containing protein n=1 Tax=Ruegeria haliotis TaxID=2747601 RepID=A0ABX2PWV3_9RHOB|nr:helix-turn-helix domain-containing protein [Ruegeria haliotis]NVO58692.1 helix-turn-helix domain-containing protein [Ruegeria haliotis]